MIIDDLTAILGPPRPACLECGAGIGSPHVPGCDVEVCPRYGDQAVACGCVYEVCGMDRETLEETHPDIYRNGPTDAMCVRFDAEWDARRVPWTGRWPGDAECVAMDLWSRWGPDMDPPHLGWVPCDRGDPGAVPDLNRLRMTTEWDPVAQRRVRPSWAGA